MHAAACGDRRGVALTTRGGAEADRSQLRRKRGYLVMGSGVGARPSPEVERANPVRFHHDDARPVVV